MDAPPDVKVKRYMPVKDRAKPFYYTSFPWRFRQVAPYHPDGDTFLHALVSRAKLVKIGGAYVPRPRRASSAVFAGFRARVAAMNRSEVHKLSVQDFVSSRPGRVRRLYELTVESKQLESRGLRDMAKLKGFLKSEKSTHSYPHISHSSKAGRPRAIQPRGPAFNCLLGPYTVPVEKVVFQDLDLEFNPIHEGRPLRGSLKGLCPVRMAEELRRHWDYHGGDGHVAALPLDMSSFDATVDRIDLGLDHEVTQGYFPGDKTLKRCHSMQFRNQMRAVTRDAVIKTTLGDMRMSGDMNTSLGNNIISFALAWEVADEFSCTFVVNGDDGVILGAPKNIEALSAVIEERYLRHGKLCTPEPVVRVFEQIEFCQTRPVWRGDCWVCTRAWDKALDNDYSGFHQLGRDSKYLAHLHAVASCGMAVASGMPILQALYEWGLKHGIKDHKYLASRELHNTGLYQAAKLAGGWRRARPIDWETRMSFTRAFGVTPAMQLAIEAELQDLPAPNLAGPSYMREFVPDNDNVRKAVIASSSLALHLFQLEAWQTKQK